MCLTSSLSELTVFKQNYALLCRRVTDISELLKYFVAENIINTDQQEEIKACITNSEKVSKLLLNISGPLETGDSNGFYAMLRIMKTYGVDATRRLANQLLTMVATSSSSYLDNVIPAISNSELWNKGA